VKAPWLSVVIPTIGRPSLTRTLDSLDAQPESDGLEVLIVGDTYSGESAELREAREHIRDDRDEDRYHWIGHNGGIHCFGQPQRTAGAREASAPWVWFSQDDNIGAQGGLAAIKLAIAEQEQPRPLFFRWRAPWRQIIWSVPTLAHGNIDADCLVFPRDIAHQVVWGLSYEGDFEAATQAFNLVGGNVGWIDELVSIARPQPGDEWWKVAA